MTKYRYRHRETYKDVRIDIRANTTKELAEKVARKRKSIDTATVDADTKLSVFGIRYLETYKKNTVAAATYRDLVMIFNKHILPGVGDKRISGIKAIEYQQMLNSKDYSNDYISKMYNLTRQIVRHAYKNRLIPYDYSLELTKPKGIPTKAGRSLSEHEQAVLLDVIRGDRAELLVMIMLYCGLRTKEARSLTWKDIDFENELLHVRGTKTINADRLVPIPLHFLPILEDHQGSPFENVCLADKQQAERAWRHIKRLMNIKMGCKVYRNKLIPPYPLQEPCRLYDLRHTYCTNLEKQGVPLSIASRLMGHANISITAKIYTHENDVSLEIARSLINNYGQQNGQLSEEML